MEMYILINVLVSCKNEEDPNKNEGARVLTTFLLLKVYREFFRRSRVGNSAVHGPIRLNFKLSPDYGCPCYLQ